MSIIINLFKNETTEEKTIDRRCKVAKLEAKVKVLWALEGTYVIGRRGEIVSSEGELAVLRVLLGDLVNLLAEEKGGTNV